MDLGVCGLCGFGGNLDISARAEGDARTCRHIGASGQHIGSNPVPTLEQEAQSAFVAQGTCQNSFEGCAVGTLYTVPAGKTAVLESVAFSCILTPSSGTSPSGVQTEAGSLTFVPPAGAKM